jgi:hypothetical protein
MESVATVIRATKKKRKWDTDMLATLDLHIIIQSSSYASRPSQMGRGRGAVIRNDLRFHRAKFAQLAHGKFISINQYKPTQKEPTV